ncbi:9442_t:CDS:2 [Paraglomus brasilianum]|uniref:Pantoate--beta-alanine ligase n=1 Tax=Paraglomus brasilianum TaxID=144538 RepID=A0A9N9FXJ4_9GLOM|nr:9442_t:CDS:2 [Paraglomus brasilianum]
MRKVLEKLVLSTFNAYALTKQGVRSFSTSSVTMQDKKTITIFKTIPSLREWKQKLAREGRTLGFVPTMGGLHEGHLSLAKQAASICDTVAVSIFVNPAQFAPHEDLDQYPRTLEKDLELLEATNSVDAVFFPTVKDIYPNGIPLDVEKQQGTFVEVKGRSHQMEGQTRPVFFRGVATVVCKLFNIVQPTHTFFGQKDAQQCVVVRSLITDLHFPISFHVGETIREYDGLAMSSRNRYLAPENRQFANVLYRALNKGKQVFEKDGIRDRKGIIAKAQEVVEAESETKDVKLDYFSLAHPRTLEELESVGEDGAILSGAIYIAGTRLIDNLLLDCEL